MLGLWTSGHSSWGLRSGTPPAEGSLRGSSSGPPYNDPCVTGLAGIDLAHTVFMFKKFVASIRQSVY